jgi:hypothetical protein
MCTDIFTPFGTEECNIIKKISTIIIERITVLASLLQQCKILLHIFILKFCSCIWKKLIKTECPEEACRKQMGSSRSVLNATCKAYIKPALQYGCEAVITATSAILDKLEMIQNQALRLITGALKSTPLASMQVLTRKNPLKTEREKWP